MALRTQDLINQQYETIVSNLTSLLNSCKVENSAASDVAGAAKVRGQGAAIEMQPCWAHSAAAMRPPTHIYQLIVLSYSGGACGGSPGALRGKHPARC